MKSMYAILWSLLGLMFGCTQTKTPPKDPVPLHDTFKIHSQILGEERTLNIWTPDQYKNGSDSLPVWYMADGGIEEDFPHIANTLAKLIHDKKIKPVILVGIENTQRRRDLTGYTNVKTDKEIAPVVGGAPKFRAFIKNELFPVITQKYRTTKEKGIIGESASGLFVMETFFLAPDMFDDYIAFDPSLWWNNHYLVRTAKAHLAKFPPAEKRIWFAGSQAEDIAKYTKELAQLFAAENYPNIHWKYSDEPNETHQTIFRAAKEKALIWTLNK